MLRDPETDRHHLNVGRIACAYAACEDHAAHLLFVRANGRHPQNDEHLPLAASSPALRNAMHRSGLGGLAKDLEAFAEIRNQLAHSVVRVDWPMDGHRILRVEGHRTFHPRTGSIETIPSDDEVYAQLGMMRAWCRERISEADSLAPGRI